MKRTRIPLALLPFPLVLGGAVVACSCTETRQALVEATGGADQYEPPAVEVAQGDKAPAPATGGSAASDALAISLEEVATGFQQPTDIQFPPNHPDKVIVLEKGGVAWLLTLKDEGGKLREASRRKLFEVSVRTPSEMGLLGLAFHPKFAENGRFFLNYNPEDGELRTHIAEWRTDPATLANAREEKVLLSVEQPYQNHDAGQLQFGPKDGYLYVGLGDGGWRGDPKENGQDKSTLLGTMLRIDVDRQAAGTPYAIPADNPFVGEKGARGEVWAYGIRNPWRYSFDEKARLVVADVGQDKWEEVSIVEKGDNLGWDVVEGRGHCFEPDTGCDTTGMKPPVWEYSHDVGQSITGGYVYTGSRVPALRGKYLVADFVKGHMWALELPDDTTALAKETKLGTWPKLWVTFGRDTKGEVFVADFGAGTLFRIGPG